MSEDGRKNERIAGYLGIAQRAGKIAAGDEAVLKNLSSPQVFMVIVATDAATDVKKKILDVISKSKYNKQITCIQWNTKIALGHMVGKSQRGALAVLDEGFAKAIKKLMDE